jgi:hypothetical protein
MHLSRALREVEYAAMLHKNCGSYDLDVCVYQHKLRCLG